MNTRAVDAIANAVLYEGYMLYPYRPSSVKNRQRFNFGVLYPRTYSEAQVGADTWGTQCECIVEASSCNETKVEVKVRFLKLVTRATRSKSPEETTKATSSWQEAIECNVTVPHCNLDALAAKSITWPFSFPEKREVEVVRDADDHAVGEVARRQELVQGEIQISAERKGSDLFKLKVMVENLTAFEGAGDSRDSALARSLVSAHILLGVMKGRFVSLLDPPENLKDVVASCRNSGIWPVLVGAEGQRDTMLASPIILYDYPQVAPESQGDFFDGAEIDEILALRILTMTDAEKHEMRHADERARQMLQRTENLPMEHLMKLHGTLRELRSLNEEKP
jgi:hypothetical protein